MSKVMICIIILLAVFIVSVIIDIFLTFSRKRNVAGSIDILKVEGDMDSPYMTLLIDPEKFGYFETENYVYLRLDRRYISEKELESITNERVKNSPFNEGRDAF